MHGGDQTRTETRRRRRGPLALATMAWTCLMLVCAGTPVQAQEPSISVPAEWSLKPAAIPAGGKFRLLMVTRTRRDALSTDIADYDAHVQGSLTGTGALADIKDYGNLFRVVGSTPTVVAREHTGTDPRQNYGVPIYWLNGEQVAKSYAQFYDGHWSSYQARREDGERFGLRQQRLLEIHTGSTIYGAQAEGRTLGGDGRVAVGDVEPGATLDRFPDVGLSTDRAMRFLGISPVFHALDPTIPHIISVEIVSDPGGDTDYATGDTIRASVTFSEAVTVTGTPTLELRLGVQNVRDPGTRPVRTADYAVAASTPTVLAFDYTVTAADNDNNGVSLAHGALRLDGATIRKSGGTTQANLYDTKLPDQGGHRVNRVPYVSRVALTSTPRARTDTYGLGETIEARVTFSEPVTVDSSAGAPVLGLRLIGHSYRNAVYRRTQGSSLVFAHVVAANEVARRIRINVDGLTTAGTIRSAATGRDADLTSEKQLYDRRVDGGLTPSVSPDATLAALRLGALPLRPSFHPATKSYMATVPHSETTTTVTAVANDSTAAVAYSLTDADTVAQGHQVNFVVGTSTLTVEVAAGNTTTRDAYTVAVTRLESDDAPEVTIAAAAARVTEGTAAAFTLTRTGATTNALTVSLTATQEGSVFEEGTPPTAATFSAGAATTTLSFPTLADTTDEPNGAVTVALMPEASYAITGTPSVTVTVEDDDATPAATLALTQATISENGGSTTVTATLDHPSSEETRLTVSAVPVAPALAADFSLSENRVLTIPAGAAATTGSVTVTATDNDMGAADKRVTVSATLANARGVTAPSALTLTLTDDDAAPEAPMNLSATSGNARAILSWDASAAADAVTSHEYRYRSSTGSYPATWTPIADSGNGGANAAGTTVTSLSNGETYWFQVRAVNANGNSEASAAAGAFIGSGLGICDRTTHVRVALLQLMADEADCAAVTAEDLAGVKGTLTLAYPGISALRADDFAGLSKLTVLEFYKDQITTLPAGVFSDLSALETLMLYGNRIDGITAAMLSGLTNLTHLDLSHNVIEELPASVFAGLPRLRTLDLRGNRIREVSATAFAGLANLTELNLSRNSIHLLPANGFKALSSLTLLNLSVNQIWGMGQETFAGLSSLTTLNMASNKFNEFSSIDRPFKHLSKLTQLVLDFNGMERRFPDTLFEGLTSLGSLQAMANHHEGNVLRLVTKLVRNAGGLQVRVPAGAPFDLVMPVVTANGSLAGEATSITVRTGMRYSDPVAVTGTIGYESAVTARFGPAPPLPGGVTPHGIPLHMGYRVDLGANPGVTVMPTPPNVSLVLTPATIAEMDDPATTTVDESVATVTATLRAAVATPFTMTVSITPEAPATAADYSLGENRTLSFAANETESTGTVTITAVDNDVAAPDKTVRVSATLSDPMAAVPRELALTIADREPPAPPSNVRAVASDGAVVLGWDAPLPGAAVARHEYRHKVQSDLAYPDTWTAIPDSAAGESHDSGYTVSGLVNGTTYTFQVRTVNAFGASEPGGNAPNGAPTSMPRLALVLTPEEITERDDPETSGEDESTATVTATLSRAVSTAFTVEVAVAPVSPAVAGDYTLSGNSTLTFAANALRSTGTVTVAAVDDDVAAADKEVTVSGSTASTDVMAPPPAILTIANDDNWAPTSADGRVETVEDTGYVFGAADFSIADADGDALASVRVVTLPAAGALKLDGSAVDAGDAVPATDLGDLVFEPAPNGYGSPYATFTFRVGDGEAESAAAYAMTVDVTAVNDAPAFTGAAALSMAENGTAAGRVRAEDPDDAAAVSYALTGGADAAALVIGAATGALTFRSAPDYENPTDVASSEPADDGGDNVYVVEVTATSGTGSRALSSSRTVTVTVTDVVETEAGERSVTGVSITSSPGDDGFYGIDDVMTVAVEFNAPVAVEPLPLVRLRVSGKSVWACYAAGNGSSTLTFRHGVREGITGSPSVVSLLSNQWFIWGTGKIYSGSADNPADLDFEAMGADNEHAFDGRRPVLRSSDLTADRQRIVLGFSEDLSATTAPAGAFQVQVAGDEAAVSAVTASGRTVTLTLAAAAGAGARVEVAYAEPTPIDKEPPAVESCGLDFADDDTHAIQDLVGNDVRAFDEVVAYQDALLTATFQDVPATHDGETPFPLRLAFSEPIRTSYKTLRDKALKVSGGSITNVHRVDGRSDLWSVTVAPTDGNDVNLSLPAPSSCTSGAAICAPGRRPLAQTIETTIPGPEPSLSVADARVEEAANATLAFTVSLSRADTDTVTVNYATSDGTATARSDYTATSGTLTFNPGELVKTVSVAVLEDTHNEGDETLTLTLSNASGAPLLDETATGTIENDDPMPAAWLARFGRTVAGQAVEAVAARMEGGGGSHVRLGEVSLGLTGVAPDGERTERAAALFEALAGTEPVESAGWTRTMTERELLLGSSFQLGAGGKAGAPSLTAWGRFATGGFDTDVSGVRMDGSVTSGFLGADYAGGRWLAGLALGLSEGEGDFALMEGNATGTAESTLTAAYPYARLGLNEKVEVWGLAGYGTGELTQTFRMNGDNETRMKTDITMRMGAVGARGELLSESSGVALALRSDALWVRTASEAVRGSAAGNLEASEGDVTRLRLVLEGTRSFETGWGTLTPSVEVGLRQDGGDAETGTGIEVGGGIRYAGHRVTAEGSVRALVAHRESGYREWGASGSVRIDPGALGRGLSFTVAPAWGAASSGLERLWSLADARGLARHGGVEPGQRIDAEVGYGLGLGSMPGVLTPYGALSLGESSGRSWRIGMRWRVAPEATLGLEATRNEPGGADQASDDSLVLNASMRW